MNVKVISRNVGYALLANALFMFFSILVSFANGNDSALAALLISFIITLTVGIFPFIFVRKPSAISLKDAYIIIVLSWLLSFVFGMLPYALWGGPFTVVNALFEVVSGYTTTGATILGNVEGLPNSLLFWRSSTHFIGGLGVVVFLLLLIPNSSQMRLRLSNLELSSLSKQTYRSRTTKTINIFTYVYLGLTFSAFICYMIAGMGPFDAINHAMAVAATGGFSTRNMSIASFNSLPITIVTMVFMLLSSIHFGIIFMVLVTGSLKPLKNEVLKFYLSVILFGCIVLSIMLKAQGLEQGWGRSILVGSFDIISYISTTGFGLSDNSKWPFMPSFFLMMFGIICGMAGSTTGGIKADRALILCKQVGYHLKKVLHPASVHEVRINGKIVSQEQIAPHILYIVLYFLVMFFSVLVCLASGLDESNSFIGTLSCLGNVGPAVGDIGTFGNYDGIPTIAKLMLTLDMFLGRVEIYPVFTVLLMIFGRKESK